MAITAGQNIHAADLNALVGLTSRLDADTSPVNNSTTLVNTGLVVALVANVVYRIDLCLIYDTSAAADFKFNITLPAGATAGEAQWGFSNTTAAADGTMFRAYNTGAGDSSGGVSLGTILMMCPILIVRTAGTAGNATVQFAQNTATAVNTVLKKDSHIIARLL